ncbi:PREDICTED: uncharacterized protein LOC104815183 [Tarenaya hassleriana]|uniref:uncharacterized protein LOC104815183 n=1 Tax=Tarenaya hassleriana TaxID=28532 RepID=UPI00053C4D7D|nr:PREDICTED: uncharacterized protein LOC104815183 [Tarenaya hassleriana]
MMRTSDLAAWRRTGASLEDGSLTEGALEDVEGLASQVPRDMPSDHDVTRSFEAAGTGCDVHNTKAPRASHRAEPPLTRARARALRVTLTKAVTKVLHGSRVHDNDDTSFFGRSSTRNFLTLEVVDV